MMKKNFYVLFAILIANLFSAQTELVRWNQNNLTPSEPTSANMTASSNYSGYGVSSLNWGVSFFEISNIPLSTTIETNNYIQFTVAPKTGYQINLSSFNLTYKANNPNQQVEVRYSSNADFSNPQTLTKFVASNAGWKPLTLSNFVNPIISSGKTMYIRMYIYDGNYSTFHISNDNMGTAPHIIGTVTADVPMPPTAKNDAFTAIKNNYSDLDILLNDVSTTSFSNINITQSPAHGTITKNGTTNVTYKPAIGYLGTDSFKYRVSNTTGESNEAIVSLTVVDNVPSPLVRWNKIEADPNPYNSKAISEKLTSTLNLTSGDYWENNINQKMFRIGGWPTSLTIDKSKYVQFSIKPENGYKLTLSDFNIIMRMQGNSSKIRAEYSLNKEFTDAKEVLSETLLGTSWTTLYITNFPKPIATEGQIIYLRFYAYSTNDELQIKFHPNNSVGPTFNGILEYNSSTPIAYDDSASTTSNDDVNVSVLINDDYSNTIDQLKINSQPSHGVATLNSNNTINYLPAKDFIGTDTFTYKITNAKGESNLATVQINIIANQSSTLIRWDKDDFSGTPINSSVASTKINAVGISLNKDTWSTPVFIASNLESSANINTSKYLQFELNNISSSKVLEPKVFSFKGSGAIDYEIRYSKTVDFSSGVSVLSSGKFNEAETTNNFNFEPYLQLSANEKLYVRIYWFKTNNNYVFQYYSGASGIEIRGLSYNKVYASADTIWQNTVPPSWSNGAPSATRNAIINTSYDTALNGNLITNDLTINSGASLKIAAKNSVTVNGKIINNANATAFTIEDSGNLLQNNNAQNTGDITVKKTALIPQMGYNYWSSPVSGQNLYQFSDGYNQATTTGTGTPWNRFFVYNESNDYFVNSIANEITLSSTSVFQPARGYAIRGKNSFPKIITPESTPSKFEFAGVPQNGDYSHTLKYTNSGRGYNMVGNPYPSNLDLDELFNENSSKIFTIAYCWTNNDNVGQAQTQQGSNYMGNNYAIYNGVGGTSATYFGYNGKKPNGYASVGQAFIVKTKVAGRDQPLNFKNNMRTASTANFFNKGADNKAGQKNRFWLEFKSPEDINNEILIGYVANATNNYDNGLDTELMSIGSDSFWSILDARKLGIQGRQENFTPDDAVKLGIKASISGNYTISLTDKDGIFSNGQTVYLRDRYLNRVINLSSGPYVFASNSGQYDDRFEVIYRSLETLGTDNSIKKGIQIYKDNQNFIVRSDENLDNVSVYDSVGRLIFSAKNAKKEVLIDKTKLSEGMYIIKANSRNTTMTKKVLR